jgi:hypothetical protein
MKNHRIKLSNDFFEKLILLAFAAVITSFLIPYILQKADHINRQDRIVYQAEIARQNKILEAKVEFLNTLHELFWNYQIMAIDVPFYLQFKNERMYNESLKQYEENAGKLIGKIRGEIAKAYRLTSQEQYEELKKFYYEIILVVDQKLLSIASKAEIKDQTEIEKWKQLQNYLLNDYAKMVDEIMNDLALELDLKPVLNKKK